MIRGLVILAALLFFPTAAHATGPLCCTGSGGGSGSSAFDAITGGTNTSAAMVVGTGASLATSGSGTIAATTAAALAANGANCSAGSAPLGVDASGAAESCTTYAPVGAKYITQTADATLTGEQALSALGSGLVANTTGTGVLSIYAGSSCSAGAAPRGLDATGAVQNCTTFLTAEVDGSTTNELQNLFETIATSSGTSPVADSTTDTLTLTGTAPVTVTGNSTTDTITLSLADVTDCSANQFVTGSGANLALVCAQPAFSNLSGSATDAQVPDTITLTDITQITNRAHSSLSGLTSGDDHTQYALLAGRSGGQTLIGGTAASNGLTLQSTSNATRGTVTVKDALAIGADVPDQTTGTLNIVDLSPTVDITGTAGAINGFYSAPTTTMSGSSEAFTGFRWNPSITTTAATPVINGFRMTGTIANSYAPSPSALPVYQVNGFVFSPTLTSSTANGGWYQDAFVDQSVVEYTGTTNVTTALNPWAPISFLATPRFATTNTGDLAIDQVFGTYFAPQIGSLNAASNVTFNDMASVGLISPAAYTGGIAAPSTITNYYGVYGNMGTSLPANLSMTNAYGVKLSGWNKATNNWSLWSDSGTAKLYNAGIADIGDEVADVSSGATSLVDVAPTIDQSGGTLNGYYFAPTTTLSGTLTTTAGLSFAPTISHNVSFGALIYGLNMGGTITATNSAAASTAAVLNHVATYTTSTASAKPVTTLAAISDQPVISSTATSGSATVTGVTTALHNPTISLNDTNGATGGVTALTITADTGYQCDGTYTETSGDLTVTTRACLKVNDVTNTSSATAITTNVGVDIAALSAGTTNIGLRNADTTVFTPATSTLSGASSTISAGQTETDLNNTSGGSLTLTSAPTIADGVDGQILLVTNTSANNVVIQDQGTLASSNLRLSATTITLGTRDSILLRYSSSIGDWIQIGQVNVL